MRTTININSELLLKLKTTSIILNISTHRLIEILIHKVTMKKLFSHKKFKTIQYQDVDPEKNWKKFHVRFEPYVYEMGLDCIKIYKYSVSYLISFAIINFLKEIENEILNSNNKITKMDNYPINYILIAKYFNGIQGLVTFWGIPKEKYLDNLIPQQVLDNGPPY